MRDSDVELAVSQKSGSWLGAFGFAWPADCGVLKIETFRILKFTKPFDVLAAGLAGQIRHPASPIVLPEISGRSSMSSVAE